MAIFILGLLVWLITWLTRPSYYVPPAPVYVRHNLIGMKHQAEKLVENVLFR